MRTSIVLTLTGRDRVGLVEEVTGVLLGLGGNVETSRMTRLGGEFAILMLVSLPAERLADVGPALERLTAQGYTLTTSESGQPDEGQSGWLPFRIEVRGADHEGIVHAIAEGLSERGISIESMETATERAPMSGAPMFTMAALVLVPPGLAESDWMAELTEAGRESNVDITVSVAESSQAAGEHE